MDKAASTGHSDRCRIVVDTCCDFSPEVAANLDVDILGSPSLSMAKSARMTSGRA